MHRNCQSKCYERAANFSVMSPKEEVPQVRCYGRTLMSLRHPNAVNLIQEGMRNMSEELLSVRQSQEEATE